MFQGVVGVLLDRQDRRPGWTRDLSREGGQGDLRGSGRLEFGDAFADDKGEIDDGLSHMTMVVTIEAGGNGTRMSNLTSFESLEDLEKVLEMGMEEGLKMAMGQIDDLI